MAYIFSGAYIPLSCKLIEQASEPGGGVKSVSQIIYFILFLACVA